ncbi:MAG TPA: YXWGXW repeat-containing protein [Verrucomicrobiae bacterium]|nr:YXWGXW repeat-containing protein [Verrucomicrobiae bacterium]
MRRISILGLVLFALVMVLVPARSSAQISVGVAVHIGPPALPVYEQPICPGAGYLWTPGYWAYGPDGYYWVPGTWVMAPSVGLLWTPGYWGWGGGGYFFHAGYWGPHVGFYGGINYGFGYGGVGFVGGRWNGGVFAYNTAVMHVNATMIHNTYVDRTVVNNVTVNNHVSFNGGTGGVAAQPTAAERAAENEHHVAPTAMQTQHEHAASTNRALLASENHGKPAIAATTKPGEFTGHGVAAAREATPHGGSTNGGNRPPSSSADLHKTDRPPSSSAGSGANSSHSNTTNSSHGNNGSNNPPKNESHAQNKPPAKSASESKPPKENKPH